MKSFTILVFSALVAIVSAIPQETASATVVSFTPEVSCAAKCPAEDICCKAQCVHVPCPNEAMANRTTECARNCVQGNGSQADTEAYGRCQFDCISSYFFTGTATLPAATGTAAGSGSATLSAASGSGSGSGSQTASATGSGTAATTKASGAANVQYQLGSTAAGIIGLIMAAFAL
jgi:hypothetical protein